MNTKVEYLYRDAANYKSHGAMVMEGVPDQDLAARLRSALFDRSYLVAAQVGIPSLAPWMVEGTPPDEELDHSLHEVQWPPTETLDPVTEPAVTFEEFVTRVERAQADGWAIGDPIHGGPHA